MKLSAKNLTSEDVKLLEEISGVNLYACYQCGNCSAGCPCVEAMDIPPHKIMRMSQFGQIDELLQTNTMWVCAACITCTARCPRSIDIAAVMEGLRNLILRKRESSDYVRFNEIDPKLYEELPQIAIINNFRKLTL
ncbi:MAG: heterodisulfide reductase [bacterium]|nr:heterodisulfide reductase [bacterium]